LGVFLLFLSKPGDPGSAQHHLELLREQYVKLQQRHTELEQKYSRAISTSGNVGPEHFVSKLVSLTAELYDKSLYRYLNRYFICME